MQKIPEITYDKCAPFQASKWLKIPLFLSKEELSALFEELFPFYLVRLSGVIEEGKGVIDKTTYLSLYEDYLKTLQSGQAKDVNRLVVGLGKELSDFRKIKVDGGELIKVYHPVIQVQPYTLFYSSSAEKFIEMTHSLENMYFGLLFSFPQLFQDPSTQEVIKVYESDTLNAKAFKAIQKWSRAHTTPTPFLINGKVLNHPARIGKKLNREYLNTILKPGILLCS